jgi:hypothetical protein
VTTSTLPRHPKLKKPSTVLTVMYSRQKTLEQLYLRRATVEKAIRSLEIYADTVYEVSQKVVAVR